MVTYVAGAKYISLRARWTPASILLIKTVKSHIQMMTVRGIQRLLIFNLKAILRKVYTAMAYQTDKLRGNDNEAEESGLRTTVVIADPASPMTDITPCAVQYGEHATCCSLIHRTLRTTARP
jgi:hypothetical protein